MTDETALNAGNGGETHQLTDADHPVLTTNHVCRSAITRISLRPGVRGPVLLEDEIFREKINHLTMRESLSASSTRAAPVRTATSNAPRAWPTFTRADLFQRKGERTEVFVRFSTVAGGAGSIDTPRDVRGFALSSTRGKATGTCRQQHPDFLYPGCHQNSLI